MTVTVIDFSTVHTLPELLAFRVAQSPQAEAYREFDAGAGRWVSTTWAQAGERFAQWRRALAAMRLPNHASIAVLLPNGLDAVSLDQAALALGHVPVPLHALDNPGSIAYILADCEAALLMVSSLAQWRSIEALGVAMPALRRVVVSDEAVAPDAGSAHVPVCSLADWLAAGQGQEGAVVPPSGDDLAAIVYTSGTTGKPKGVMLTHRNVVANVQAILARVVPTVDDVFLSFLPLSHTFERTAGYYLPMASGSCVVYARSVSLLAEDLKTVRPTVLISVPRIYERACRSPRARGAPGSGWTRCCGPCWTAWWRAPCVRSLAGACGWPSAAVRRCRMRWPAAFWGWACRCCRVTA